MRIIQTVGAERLSLSKMSNPEDASFPNDILMSLTSYIMEMTCGPESAVVDTLLKKVMNKFLDVKFYSYRNFQ
jgi:hypothetical protein